MMKRAILFVSICILSLLSKAQGITFSKPANWNALLEQAKSENKFIFLDGYTTWCGPCKMMDRNVYGDIRIGNQMNPKFISVKLQVDKTVDDDEFVQSWYKDAEMLTKRYAINAFPTLIFLSPEGEILYSSVGYVDLNKFSGIMQFATDSAAQKFRPKLEAYRKGVRNYSELPSLIKVTKRVLRDDSLSNAIGKDYYINYINKQADLKKIMTPEVLELLVFYDQLGLLNSTDRFVQLLRKNRPQVIDSSMRWQGITASLLGYVARKEELEAKLWKNGKIINPNPDWEKFGKVIKSKYPQVDADEVISHYIRGNGDGGLSADGFYYRTGNMSMFNQMQGKEIANFFKEGHFVQINNVCWFTYFIKITDRKSLELASRWMDTCLSKSILDSTISAEDRAGWTDTKAALLYKLGQRQQAIETEEMALRIKQEDNLAKGKEQNADCRGYIRMLEIMNKGEKIVNIVGGYVVYPKDWKLND